MDEEIYREGGCVDVCVWRGVCVCVCVCVCVHLNVSVAVISQER